MEMHSEQMARNHHVARGRVLDAADAGHRTK